MGYGLYSKVAIFDWGLNESCDRMNESILPSSLRILFFFQHEYMEDAHLWPPSRLLPYFQNPFYIWLCALLLSIDKSIQKYYHDWAERRKHK